MKHVPIIAAVFARSNLGLGLPEKESVQFAIEQNLSLESAVEHFCGQFIENEANYDMFVEEAQGWSTKLSAESSLDHWPEIKELFS